MAGVPSSIEASVARAIFADMAELGWSGLSHSRRSEQYARWIKAADVGGRLTAYMPEERARVWIKDGPVKEWRRALAGIGRYAGMVEGGTRPGDVVRRVLGADWTLDEDSVRVKPLRVRAYNHAEDQEVILVWGPSRDLKHLLWSALVAAARGDSERWHVAVVGTFTHPIAADERAFNQRLAARVQVPLTHVELG